MKHASFQLCRAHPDGVILKKLTVDNNDINKGVWVFIHHTKFLSSAKEKKLLWRWLLWGSHLSEMALWLLSKNVFMKLKEIKSCW